MLGPVEDLPDRAGLDDLAVVHHRHPVGDLRDHAEVVGDEQEAHAGLRLQLREQRQDLRLHGDVEGGGRLVGDQHVGAQRQRHGDHHPLPLAAGELVRIVAGAPLRIGDADPLEQRRRRAPCASRGEASPCARSVSPICQPTL